MVVILAMGISFSPLHAAETRKEESTSWTGAKIVAGVFVGFTGLATFFCKKRFGGLSNCFKNLDFGGFSALPAAGIANGPNNGERINGNNDFGPANEGFPSTVLTGIIEAKIENQIPDGSRETLQKHLSQFMEKIYNEMSPENKDPSRFCLRRARIIRQQWNAIETSNMGSIYVLQRQNATQIHLINGQWTYHVAAFYRLRHSSGETEAYVLDPLFESALTAQEWMRRLGLSKQHHRVVTVLDPNKDYDVGFTFSPTGMRIPTEMVLRQ